MGEVLRSPLAETDLLEIWSFIAEDSFDNADRFLDLLAHKATLLAENPSLGRQRPDLAPGLRSFPVRRYVLYYRPTRSGIELVRVLSAFRDAESLLGD